MPTNPRPFGGQEADRPKTTKNITFYKAGDERFKGVLLPVNQRKYRTLDALLDDLSYKVPGLSYGVRRLATPRGKHTIKNIEQLSHGSNYICSDKLQARQIPAVKLARLPGGDNYRFKTHDPPDPPVNAPRRKTKSRSPRKSRSPVKRSTNQLNSKPPIKPDQNETNPRKPPIPRRKQPRKGRNMTKSKSRHRREAYSAPATPHERRDLELSLSPLDKGKLKHEQRRRVAEHSIDTDNYTLPSSNSSGGSRTVVKKKKKKKTKNLLAEKPPMGFVSDVTVEDWKTEDHHKAATVIQRSYRGYLTRREMNDRKRAAVRIQSRYRGYKTRENLGITHNGGRSTPRSPSKEPSKTALADFSDTSYDTKSTTPATQEETLSLDKIFDDPAKWSSNHEESTSILKLREIDNYTSNDEKKQTKNVSESQNYRPQTFDRAMSF